MFTWPLTYQQSVFKPYHSNRFLSVLPTRWQRKTAGVDMKQNYVTVTLCIRIHLLTYLQSERLVVSVTLRVQSCGARNHVKRKCMHAAGLRVIIHATNRAWSLAAGYLTKTVLLPPIADSIPIDNEICENAEITKRRHGPRSRRRVAAFLRPSPATICTRRTRIVRPQLQTTTATPKQIIKRCSDVLMFNDTKLCLYVLLDGCVVPPRRCRSCNSYPGVYTTTRRNTDWSLQPTIGLISLQRQSKTRQLTAYC